MKFPKYMAVVSDRIMPTVEGNNHRSRLNVVIKWWGKPIIIFKYLFKSKKYPWYLMPYAIFRAAVISVKWILGFSEEEDK